jgi:hypothetical protein
VCLRAALPLPAWSSALPSGYVLAFTFAQPQLVHVLCSAHGDMALLALSSAIHACTMRDRPWLRQNRCSEVASEECQIRVQQPCIAHCVCLACAAFTAALLQGLFQEMITSDAQVQAPNLQVQASAGAPGGSVPRPVQDIDGQRLHSPTAAGGDGSSGHSQRLELGADSSAGAHSYELRAHREEDEDEEGLEEEGSDVDDEDEDDDDDDSSWHEGIPHGLEGLPWLRVLHRGGSRDRHFTKRPPKHSLHGYIPEEPSEQWLHPDGDGVVQRFRGVRPSRLY